MILTNLMLMRLKRTDTPIAGVTVELFNASDLDNAIASTETNELGFYEFIDLANGEYVVVKETQPSGYDTVSLISTDTGNTNQIAAIIADGDSVGNDFLEEVPPELYQACRVRVLSDVDNDNDFGDGDECDYSRWIRSLSDSKEFGLNANASGEPIGEPIATTETDENGFYVFDNLPNGNYVIVKESAI